MHEFALSEELLDKLGSPSVFLTTNKRTIRDGVENIIVETCFPSSTPMVMSSIS